MRSLGSSEYITLMSTLPVNTRTDLPGSASNARRGRSSANVTIRDVPVAAAAVLMVMAPMLFTSSGFAPDFTNHLWLTWVAGKELVQGGSPGYFLSTSGLGVFYPMFAFYGGTLYT